MTLTVHIRRRTVRRMAETFVKLFGSILDSTIWAEDSDTKVVWVTLLAMSDQNGYVGASVPGLSARSGVPIPKIEEALAKFLAPDPYSRSQEHEGRRIVKVDRGWELLNYQKFRELRDKEKRREQFRDSKRRGRAAEKRALQHAGISDDDLPPEEAYEGGE